MGKRRFCALMFGWGWWFCSITSTQATPQLADTTISSVRFIGHYAIQHNESFKGTVIGGLSGIDYNPANKLFYLLSDDRSVINPARFYTANINVNTNGIANVEFKDVITLKQQNGKAYDSPAINHHNAIDPEAIRYNRIQNHLVWASEGDRRHVEKEKIFINPSITIAQLDGASIGTFPLPENLKIRDHEGPLQNGALEGLTFNTDFTILFTSLEEPLLQDGFKADVNKPNALVRIYAIDAQSHVNIAQYAYPLEAVAHDPVPATSFKLNGVSEILYVHENELLVVERSFSTGQLGCTIKLFMANFSQAENVKDVSSLAGFDLAKAVTKKMLFNFDSLGIYIDNIEGVTFGPVLPNGHNTLVFVADNNFLPTEQTQFFLFEVIP